MRAGECDRNRAMSPSSNKSIYKVFYDEHERTQDILDRDCYERSYIAAAGKQPEKLNESMERLGAVGSADQNRRRR